MKASDFIEMLAEEIDCTYVDARTFLRGLRNCVSKVLLSGEGVLFYGLGKFNLRRYGERENFDLNSRKMSVYPAVTRVVFTPSKVLRKKVENVIPVEPDVENDMDEDDDNA